jgi:hypothetical protein
MELLQRLHGEAVPVLVKAGSEAQSSREDAETDRRFRLGTRPATNCWTTSTRARRIVGAPVVPAPRRVRSSCPHGDRP